MSDEADRADLRIEQTVSDSIGEASRAVASMPAGEPGECDGCGEHFERTVKGYCGRCRDKFARLLP
jgi:predicted amidophosphoribosyltransferase